VWAGKAFIPFQQSDYLIPRRWESVSSSSQASPVIMRLLLVSNPAALPSMTAPSDTCGRYLSSQVRQFDGQVFCSSGWGWLIQDCSGISGVVGRWHAGEPFWVRSVGRVEGDLTSVVDGGRGAEMN